MALLKEGPQKKYYQKSGQNISEKNIDFPISFLKKIDKEAEQIGVARTALIKMWLAERLENTSVK
jgi:hypothetical protein